MIATRLDVEELGVDDAGGEELGFDSLGVGEPGVGVSSATKRTYHGEDSGGSALWRLLR
jgi:hypothetical protein